jgi:hypothetical protein
MPAQNFLPGHEYVIDENGTTAVWGGPKKGWMKPDEYVSMKGQSQAQFDDRRVLMDRLDQARNDSTKRFATGFMGRLTSGEGLPDWSPFKGFGGTPGYALDKELVPVRANAFIQNLTNMRQNSPTGGAVGNVTEKEGEKLQSTDGILDVGQPGPQLRREIDATKSAMVRHQPGLGVTNPFALGSVSPDEIPQGAYFETPDHRVFQNRRGAPAPAAVRNQAPVRVGSVDEAMALPPGTVFVTPDGRRKVR